MVATVASVDTVTLDPTCDAWFRYRDRLGGRGSTAYTLVPKYAYGFVVRMRVSLVEMQKYLRKTLDSRLVENRCVLGCLSCICSASGVRVVTCLLQVACLAWHLLIYPTYARLGFLRRTDNPCNQVA